MTQTPLNPGLVARIASAARYVISGVKPDAWFGPLQPLEPMAPPDVAGRRFDYPTGYNLNSTPRSYDAVSFEELRALADNCDIVRSVIETRKDQIEAQEWTVRAAVKDTSAKIPQATDDQKRRIDGILTFLRCPDGEHGFEQWLRQILEDMFVIDGVAIYKRRNRAGGLYALEVIDPAAIKLLLDDSGRRPAPPDPAYQQILKGVPAADYTREELMYLVHNPRSHRVYGYSHVEQILVTVNILIRRAMHQLEYYREGSAPDALVGVPKEWSSDQIVDFQRNFDAMLAGNLGQRRRMRFMPGSFQYQELKAPPLKDAYDEFLARIVCFVFSISPEPFVGQVNRATAETSHSRAIDEGLAPLMRFVRSFMNRIIACEFASPDLEFVWQDAREQDPAQAAQVDVAYVGAGILTVDEVRANMGLLPVESVQKPVVPNAAAQKKTLSQLRKDGDDDDSDEEESDDSDGSGPDVSDDGGGGDDFDSKHSRWAAGSPGGIGGEFAPRDSGDATNALHEAISEDAKTPIPLDPNSTWAALTSGLDKPSKLSDDVEVAGNINEGIAAEIAAENQSRVQTETQAEIDAAAARQAATDAPAARQMENEIEQTPSISGLAEAIGNATAATPYINPNGTLVNAENAVIDPNKIVGYALNPENDKGSNKAVVFNSALGYNQSNADGLIQQLQQGVKQNTATVKGVDQYGVKFTVNIPVTGPNGNIATVLTGWIYDPGSTTPRLVTARIKN